MLLVGLFVLGALCAFALMSYVWALVLNNARASRSFIAALLRHYSARHGVLVITVSPLDEQGESVEYYVDAELEDIAEAIASEPRAQDRLLERVLLERAQQHAQNVDERAQAAAQAAAQERPIQ
jgi:hypothetical protein